MAGTPSATAVRERKTWPAIAGMGRAAELAAYGLAEDSQRIARLRDRLERGLLERVRQAWINGARAPRVPNTTNLTFPFIEGEAS